MEEDSVLEGSVTESSLLESPDAEEGTPTKKASTSSQVKKNLHQDSITEPFELL